MTCKIDHALPGMLPPMLCRHCHPELNLTDKQRASFTAAEKVERDAANAKATAKRELARATAKLNGLTRSGRCEPAEGTVNARIAKSMRKKIARLEKELGQS